MAYSPIGSPGRPEKVDSDPVLLDDPIVKEISDRLNVTPAQVSIIIIFYNNYIYFLFNHA